MLVPPLLLDGLLVGEAEGVALEDTDGEALTVADSDTEGDREGEADSVASQLVSSARVPSSTFWHTRTYSIPCVLKGVSLGVG